MQNHLVIMVKAPRPGRVKTRLARDIGAVPACWWARHQISRLIRKVGRDPRWRTWLAVAPDRSLHGRDWPRDLDLLAQGSGSLGARMGRVFRQLPPGRVIIVGADIPGIRADLIASAFATPSADAVIGPSPDGGYWMVGLLRRGRIPSTLFDNVRWSTETARADTVRSLGDLRIAEAATLVDVDTLADLREVRAKA